MGVGQDTMELADAALLSRFCEGDTAAFECLYLRHRGGLYGYALSLALDAGAAADAVQETWLVLVQQAERLAGVENLRAYLYRSVRNRLVDELRRRQRERAATRQLALVKPRHTGIPADDAEALNAALEGLPAEQREVVLLRIYGGLKFGEVAEVTGENLKTVESRHRLALEKLHEALGGMQE